MAAEHRFELETFDVDLAELDELREAVKYLISEQKKGATFIKGFNDNFAGKPGIWGGESEAEFKSWTERLSMFMSNAGDKKWKTILRQL